jgi:hypothetical protein
MTSDPKATKVKNLSETKAKEFFDRQARRYLGISGREFVRKWDRKEFNGKMDSPAVVRLSVLLPFAR